GQNYVKDNVAIYGKGKKFQVPEDDVLGLDWRIID
ncbi:hypothetical protein SS7213T_02503, partial [Staphylococcus simiae CCM 7213 = CCUG 51256]